MPAGPRAFRSWKVRLRVAVAVLGAVAVSSVSAVATLPASASASASAVVVVATRRPRVLLMGDSIMDQQGSHAAFALRQAGVDAKSMGLWGSSLLTRDQYDYGRTNRSGGWLKRAADQIATFDPDVVAVYLNHNYWPPYPRDAAGRLITDLWGADMQSMLHAQATALITILRARGARVYFVAPIPAGGIPNPDPNAWNPFWHGYLPVLHALSVPVIDSARPLRGPTGLRVESKPSCTGAPERIRAVNDLHLARYGAGLAGTVLAQAIARIVGVNLDGNGAPGDFTTALVPAAGGHGYWLVGCDGSVFHFGSAPHLPGARAAIAGHHGVAAAAATPDGKGLWLVATDGTIAPVGDAPALTLRGRPATAITGAIATSDGRGLVATTRDGIVLTAGTARAYGDLAGRHPNGQIRDIEATPNGRGYWLTGTDGGVYSFGDAHFFGSMGGLRLVGRIVGMAATPSGHGYWLVGADGGIFAFGDAKFLGTARYVTPPYPYNLLGPPPGPSVDVVAAAGPAQGYWVVGNTGRVTNAGAAAGHTGDNGLALGTQ